MGNGRGSDLGFFNIVIGLIFEVKNEVEGAIGCYYESLGEFERNGDQLFMMLTID